MNSDHLKHAEGWLELGDYTSASEELDKLPANQKASIQVLDLRLCIYTAAKKWSHVEAISRGLCAALPGSERHFLILADALHKQGKNQEAFDVLLPLLHLNSVEIHYHCVCYACQAGHIFDALDLMFVAIEMGIESGNDIRQRALDDPRLEEIWEDISEG